MTERKTHIVLIRLDMVSEGHIIASLEERGSYLREAMRTGSLYGENYNRFMAEFGMKGFVETNTRHLTRFVTINPLTASHRICGIYKNADGDIVGEIEILDKEYEKEIIEKEFILSLMPRAMISSRGMNCRIITFDLLVQKANEAEVLMKSMVRMEIMIANEKSYFRNDWHLAVKCLKEIEDPNNEIWTVKMEANPDVKAFKIRSIRVGAQHTLYASVECNNYTVYNILKDNKERACNHIIFYFAGHDKDTFGQTAENKFLYAMTFDLNKHQGATPRNIMSQTEA